jgi:pilus assembly protein CpaC
VSGVAPTKPAAQEPVKPATQEPAQPAAPTPDKPATQEPAQPAAPTSDKPATQEPAQPAAPTSDKPATQEPAQPAAPTPAQPAAQAPARASSTAGKLTVTVGKSLIVDSPVNIQRISVANGDLIEAVAVGPKEVLINGKAPGETSVVVWQQGGTRLLYDLTVRIASQKLDAVRAQIARDFPDTDINVTYDNDTAFVRGTVKDTVEADRIMAMVATLGKAINLMHVQVPDVDPQILLKVRFADVDRSASMDLGANIATGAFNQSTGFSTGVGGGTSINASGGYSLSESLNVFLFRKDINLGVVIKALQDKKLLETLAEPNLLAINGKVASFVQGGEFPYPTVQGNLNAGAISIAFREFGIRLSFLPQITPRGTIRMQVAPEVSSLDYSNSVTVSGTTVPGLSTRKVQTEVELDSGQSFVIAGLMDRSMAETISKIPGLASIPLLGKLFQSKSETRNSKELLVIVTPELVRPIPVGKPVPELNYPKEFMPALGSTQPRHPGMDQTGPVPVTPPSDTMPIEVLQQQQRQAQQGGQQMALPQQPSIPQTQAPSPGLAGNGGK